MNRNLKTGMIILPLFIALACTACGTAKNTRAMAEMEDGLAFARVGDDDTAIEHYNQAIKLNPKYPEAYYNRGNAYRNKGDYDQAVADYTQTISLNPEYAEAYLKRGNAYRNKGDYDRAIADLDQAISLNLKEADILQDIITEIDRYNDSGKATKEDVDSLETALDRIKKKEQP